MSKDGNNTSTVDPIKENNSCIFDFIRYKRFNPYNPGTFDNNLLVLCEQKTSEISVSIGYAHNLLPFWLRHTIMKTWGLDSKTVIPAFNSKIETMTRAHKKMSNETIE